MEVLRRHVAIPLFAICTALGGACSSSSTPSSTGDAAADGSSSSSSGSSSGSGSSGSSASGSSSSGSGSSSSSSSGGDACGLAFFPSDYAASCQGVADETCCSQEQACAANAGCVALVACINACPPPRKDSCTDACGPTDGATPPGLDQLNAIADCSRAPDAGWPSSCQWP
ncbi:MAG: hypothetical protein ACLP1X_31605 [Polyangiaceae bacterium]